MDRRGNPPQISVDECIEIITDVDFLLSECKVIIELEAKLTELTRQHHVLHDFLIAAQSAVALSRSRAGAHGRTDRNAHFRFYELCVSQRRRRTPRVLGDQPSFLSSTRPTLT
jgi:hypothetical protein